MLTTTQVAKRAGVSVGTLYQYFPNKDALLFSLLQRHFEEMAEAMERVSAENTRWSLVELAEDIADAYVAVKLARPDATTALYRVASAIDQFRLAKGIYNRLEAAVVRALANAADATFSNPEQVAFTLLAAVSGLSRASFGALVDDPKVLSRLRDDARMVLKAYLRAAADNL